MKRGYETANCWAYDLLRQFSQENRKHPTEAENILWNALRASQCGVRFRRQHIIGDYIADFVCLSRQLIIEVDGEYHNRAAQMVSDEQRTEDLKRLGFRVLRIKNEEITANIDKVVEKIKVDLGTSPSPLERAGERLLIVSAPSGSGKSTIVHYLMDEHPEFRLAFSVSATSRPPRGKEQDGVEYYFISPEEFREHIKAGDFLEYEEVYLLDVFDGILPQKIPSQEDILANTEDAKLYEEERRLYYVAMTRAKRALYLFSCGHASAFTREVIARLPRAVLDEDDVFHALRQNLCGRTYRDSILGTGKITAQCGETLLVEYQSGQTQLLTLEEMICRWDRSVQYEAPAQRDVRQRPMPTNPAPVKREPYAASRTAWGAMPDLKEDAEPTVKIPPLSIGMEVYHKKFGKGVIEFIDGGKLSVRFSELGETKRLSLAFSFQSKLLSVN